jgi:hypothetical protein
MNKIKFFYFLSFIVIFSECLFANQDFPSDDVSSDGIFSRSYVPSVYNEGIDPPPTSPLDSYLIITIVFCVVFAALYFYKYNKNILKDEN